MEKIVYFPSYFALPLFFFWWWFVVCCIDGPTLLFPTWSSCWLAESHCRTLGVGDIISSGLGEPQSGMEILSVWGKGGFFYYYFPFSFKGQLSSGGDSSISLPLDAHVGTFSLLLKLLQPKSAGLFLRNPLQLLVLVLKECKHLRDGHFLIAGLAYWNSQCPHCGDASVSSCGMEMLIIHGGLFANTVGVWRRTKRLAELVSSTQVQPSDAILVHNKREQCIYVQLTEQMRA